MKTAVLVECDLLEKMIEVAEDPYEHRAPVIDGRTARALREDIERARRAAHERDRALDDTEVPGW